MKPSMLSFFKSLMEGGGGWIEWRAYLEGDAVVFRWLNHLSAKKRL